MEDRVKLTADDSDYQNVMRRAGNTADQFRSRIEKASHGFESLFKRTPGRRAELALTNLTSSLVSGDVSGAVTAFAGRISGLGLGIGVAIGAGVEIFQKLHESIKITTADSEALHKELSKPASLLAGLSPEGIGEQADRINAVYEKMIADHSTFTNKLAQYALDSARNPKNLLALSANPLGSLSVSQDLGKGEMEQTREEQDALDRRHFLERARGRNELVKVNVLAGIDDPKRRERAEMAFKLTEREAELKLHPDKGTQSRLAALNVEWDEYLKKNKLGAALKESQLKMEERLVALQRKGLVGDDLRKVRAGFEIERLDEQIAAEKSPQARRALQLERAQKVNEVHSLLAPAGPSNPFPWGTASSREFERQFGYMGFTKRSIEDSLGFGGLAKASIDRGDSLTPEEALLKTGTSADDIAAYRKNVGNLKGDETRSPDVVSAVDRVNATMEKFWGDK